MTTLVAATGVVLASAPSAAADDPASFDVGVRATYFRGTVNFYNRSASVDGLLRGLSTGCRRGVATAVDSAGNVLDRRSTSLVCSGVVERSIPLVADVPGGAAFVEVAIADADGNNLDTCIAFRGNSSCM
jgi:hypothetical protein